MARTYVLRLDTEDLIKRSNALGELTAGEIGNVIVNSLNEIVSDAYDLSRNRMIAGINLSHDYLKRKMEVTKATPSKPVASIFTVGSEVGLRNYDAKMVIVPRKTTRPNRNQGKLGIAQGMKQVAVNIEVPVGAPEDFDKAFMLPLRRGRIDGGNGLGVFTRAPGAKKPRVMLGPAVYQLFKYQLEGTVLGKTEEWLAAELAMQLEAEMERVLSK